MYIYVLLAKKPKFDPRLKVLCGEHPAFVATGAIPCSAKGPRDAACDLAVSHDGRHYDRMNKERW